MANWLDKYEQGGLVLKKKTKDNFGKKANPNDVKVSVGPDFVGLGYNTKGRNYSPAWGGQFQMGGSMPGAVGFTYARVAGSAPANGKYTKKTKASAQNGQEMKFYQEGLDFKPKSISKNGSVIKDDRGQLAHPGEITEIGSNDITMQGVNYPVLGVSDTGDTQMMYPDQDYKFDGEKVTEYPMMKKGGWLNKYK
jgi:ribosomal protein L27